MRTVSRMLVALSLLLTASFSHAQTVPVFYVGYSFIYSESKNLCAFMRFRADSFDAEEADRLYAYFADRLAAAAEDGSTFAHTFPTTSLVRGETGEQMGQEFVTKGVGACSVAGEPVDGLMFVSAFNCDLLDQPQMCIRLYVDTGAQDATPFGIARAQAGLGGIHIPRTTWDASSGLVDAGRTQLPFAVNSALTHAASVIQVFSD